MDATSRALLDGGRRRQGALMCAAISVIAATLAYRAATTSGSTTQTQNRDSGDLALSVTPPQQWTPTAACRVEDCSTLNSDQLDERTRAKPDGARKASRSGVAASSGVKVARPGAGPARADGAVSLPDQQGRWSCDGAACTGIFSKHRSTWTCDSDGRCRGTLGGSPARWTCDANAETCRGRLFGGAARWSCRTGGTCEGTIGGSSAVWRCVDSRCDGTILTQRTVWRCADDGRCHGRGSPAMAAFQQAFSGTG